MWQQKFAATADYADLKVGMRIVITAVTDEDDDKSVATVIELGPDVAAK